MRPDPLLFVLVGDPFLCEEKRREIIASLQEKSGAPLSVTVHRAGENPTATLLSEARTLPFLASGQVLCLREAARLTRDDLELFEAYFHSPQSQTFFIFETEDLEKSHPFLAWSGRRGQVIFLAPESQKRVRDFIRRKLAAAGKKMTADAGRLLESRIGDSPMFLDSVLDQLILFTGGKTEIDSGAVDAFEEKLSRFDGFDLLRELSQRHLTRALEILNGLFEETGEDLPSLLGILHWQLRRFWEAKRWADQGMTEREISERLRLYSAKASLFFSSLARFSVKDLERILEGLFELDLQFKSGRAGGRYEIERWLVQSIG